MIELAKLNGYILFEDKEGFNVMVEFPNKDTFPLIQILDPVFYSNNNGKYDIKIGTISTGFQTIEELNHLMEQYNKAIEAANYFKVVISDNRDIEFI